MIWPTKGLDTDSGSLAATKVAFEEDLSFHVKSFSAKLNIHSSEVNFDLQLGSQCTQIIFFLNNENI